MRKYWLVFQADWQSQFVYRLNFVLWRVRNILRILMTYFLWNGVFLSGAGLVGYSRPQILTYVFLVLAVQSLVLSAPSADNVGGEIASGELSNFLVKPVSYVRYWFTRDISSKLLNLIFAVFELSLLWFFLRPQISVNLDFISLIFLFIFLAFAVLIYYFIGLTVRFVAFWVPENTWGLSFVLLILVEVFSGLIFPLDLLPETGRTILQFTPFPYLVYFPVSAFLGKLSHPELLRFSLQSFLWVLAAWKISDVVWRKGLKVYSSEGQ